MDHDRAVTMHHLAAENSLDEGYWDDAFREVEYYENSAAPAGPLPDDKGRMKGEFDVLLVNYDDKTFMYKELKTSYGDLYKADQQLERAEDHFEEFDWEMIGTKILEQ